MTEKKISPNLSVGHVRNQWYAVAAANLIVLSHGSLFGWISPVLPLLKSNDTPLSTGPLSTGEVSWVVSLGSLGCIITAFTYPSIMNRIGSKRLLTSCVATLSIIGWALFAFGRTKYEVLMARFISGCIGACIDSALLLFASEIADDRIRGALGSLSSMVRVTGALVGVVVATYFEYTTVPLVFMGLPIAFLAIFLWLPNTPTYFIRTGQHEDAKKSIRFYKGYSGESVEVTNALNQEYERLLSVTSQNAKKTESMTIQKLLKPAVYKGILIGVVLSLLNQYCGCITLMLYSVMIFQGANTHIDPYMSTIILGAAQLAGTISSTSLVETLGRKALLLISMAGCTIGLSTMATYMYLSSLGYDLATIDWIPVVSLSFVVFVGSVGIMSLTFLCIVESLPTEARSFGLAVSIVVLNSFAFCSFKLFPMLCETINLYGVMLMYAIVCAFGTIFVSLVIKETKGESLDNVGHEK